MWNKLAGVFYSVASGSGIFLVVGSVSGPIWTGYRSSETSAVFIWKGNILKPNLQSINKFATASLRTAICTYTQINTMKRMSNNDVKNSKEIQKQTESPVKILKCKVRSFLHSALLPKRLIFSQFAIKSIHNNLQLLYP
jgi:hypothetical protein